MAKRRERLADLLEFSSVQYLMLLRLVHRHGHKVLHRGVQAANESAKCVRLYLHLYSVQRCVRALNGVEVIHAQQLVLLCLPFSCLPSLLVRTGHEMFPHTTTRQHWMSTHVVDKLLQLRTPVFDELFLIAT